MLKRHFKQHIKPATHPKNYYFIVIKVDSIPHINFATATDIKSQTILFCPRVSL